MQIQIKDNKKPTCTQEVEGNIFELKTPLQEIYQNTQEVAWIKLEKSFMNAVGCRVTGNFRCINNALMKNNKNPLSFNELDALCDEGGIYNDCWADGYYDLAQTEEYEDLLNANKLIEKINKKFDLNLKYILIRDYTEKNKQDLYNLIINDTAATIKMQNLGNIYPLHFVNIDAVVKDEITKQIYFRMKETWNYYRQQPSGYDKLWIPLEKVGYYEIII